MLDSRKIETKDQKYYRSTVPRYGKIATKDRGREGVGRSIFSQLKMRNIPELLMSPLRAL